MGLEVVVEEIREIGQKEATAIRNEANEEARRILAAAEDRATSIKQEAEAEVDRQVQQMEAQEVSAAKLLVRREVLNAQKELLEEVFNATDGSISALPATFHEKVIRELLKKVAKEIKDGVVFCNSRDQHAVLLQDIQPLNLSLFPVKGKLLLFLIRCILYLQFGDRLVLFGIENAVFQIRKQPVMIQGLLQIALALIDL